MDHLEHSALIVRKGASVGQLIRDAETASTPETALALYLKARDAASAISRAARYQLALYSKVPGGNAGDDTSDGEKVA